MRRKSGQTPSATPFASIVYVAAMPKMWWSGRSISERSPGAIGSALDVDSTNVSIARSESSTARGSDVVPLVKTIVAVRSGSGASRCQTVRRRSPSAFTAVLRKKSVLRDPKLPVESPGKRAATSCAFSA